MIKKEKNDFSQRKKKIMVGNEKLKKIMSISSAKIRIRNNDKD